MLSCKHTQHGIGTFFYHLLKIFLVLIPFLLYLDPYRFCLDPDPYQSSLWIRIRYEFLHPGSGSVSKLYGSATLKVAIFSVAKSCLPYLPSVADPNRFDRSRLFFIFGILNHIRLSIFEALLSTRCLHPVLFSEICNKKI